jgi:hypothetical protein
MDNPKTSLVLTTIFDPVLLSDYYDNFSKYGHLDEIDVIVIPDKKTPAATYERCAELSRCGMKIQCPTMEEQNAFLGKVGLPAEFIPENSDNRRNIGYLMAYGSGSDMLISIDDDNYCTPGEDFFKEHAVVCGGTETLPVLQSSTKFFNICDLLEFDCAVAPHPRGFPYYARHQKPKITTANVQGEVHINAGLWRLDPDIDGITWLVLNPHVTAFKGKSVVLGAESWTPVNSQNTAMRRDAIAAYYFIRMGYPLAGMPIDRYGDIFSGYFVQACANQMGGHVRAGTPVAEHKRNTHNYMRDATNEWGCILVLEEILAWLVEARLEGSTYIEAFHSLSEGIQEAVEKQRGPVWSDAVRGYFHRMGYQMRMWLNACKAIDHE